MLWSGTICQQFVNCCCADCPGYGIKGKNAPTGAEDSERWCDIFGQPLFTAGGREQEAPWEHGQRGEGRRWPGESGLVLVSLFALHSS